MEAKAVRVDTQLWSGGPGRLGRLCKLSTFCPARGPRAIR
jgi:hypothetical protein